MTETARAGIDVVTGVIPGQPEEEFTRRWFLSSTEWQERGVERMAEINDEALAYARKLMLRPDRFNWVKVEWVWF